MSHTISKDDHYSQGESVTWEFTVEEGGSAKDISGASLEWYLVPNSDSPDSDAIADHNTSGVSLSFTSDGSDGRFDLVIDQGTITRSGSYWQRVKVDDSGTGLQKWGGNFPIDEV